MTKKNYTDHDIEQLLQEMPKLNDHRSKNDVFNQLKQHTEPPRKKSRPWLPAVISVAALFVMVLFVQSLLGTMSNDENHMEMSEGAADRAMSGSEESAEMDTAEEAEVSDSSMLSMNEPTSSRLLLSSDPILETHTVLPFAMDYNAYAVPVTLLIPNDRIEADFGTQEVSNLDLYFAYAPLLDEEALGFSLMSAPAEK